jgi:hypothetical protein
MNLIALLAVHTEPSNQTPSTGAHLSISPRDQAGYRSRPISSRVCHMVLRVLALLGLMVAFAGGARAEEPTTADRAAIRQVIEQQIEAFRRDDGEAAFGFASPTIRGMFGAPDVFMDMVRSGYRPVYRPKTFEFGALISLDGKPTQKVDVIGPDGRPVVAFYVMTRLADGSWRIDGCYLQAPDEHQA